MTNKLRIQIFQPSYSGRIKFFLTNIVLLFLSFKLTAILPFLGWPLVMFFGFAFLISVYRFIPGTFYLSIDSVGFTTKVNFNKIHYEWWQIEKFFVKKIATKTAVAYNFSSKDADLKNKARPGSKLLGYEGLLPDGFGCKPDELCGILEEYRKESSVK
ncbi:hypothetical protein KAJ27_07915 [bacterium]|nr:hypothetical protein [bacterium]